MTVSKVLFSSKNQGWGTPPDLWEKLNGWYHFKLDAATRDSNPLKTEYYYTKEMDGLAEENRWINPTYVNPPYGKGIYNWVKRASHENLNNKIIVVMLVPARTDTKWFHEFIWDKHYSEPKEGIEVSFLQGRLRMYDYDNNKFADHVAPFPSMIVVFNPIQSYKR